MPLVRIEVGEQTTETNVIVGGLVTNTVALLDCVESCTDVAVTVPVPAAEGVKTAVSTPDETAAPSVAVQFTAGLKAPVPNTVAVQLELCVVRMEGGEQSTEIDVIVGGGKATVTIAEPDLVGSCVDVAVIVAVPAPAGVKTPALLIVPMLLGLTDHITVKLKSPVPVTACPHAEVWVVRMEVGEQLT